MTYTIGFLVDSVPITEGILAGTESLGGSESACLGLARALVARGHDVRIFASNLHEDCPPVDQAGVVWHPLDTLPELNRVIEFDVFVILRAFPQLASYQPQARLVLLWHQDLLTVPEALMSVSWAADRHVYVSDYQRCQYEDRLPDLCGHGWVTKNGYDPALVPSDVVKDPARIIHISRPERGLKPLLAMWPKLRELRPNVTLQIARYRSMYDGEGSNVKATCEAFDRAVERINAEVGGITYLGALGKPDLYRAIAEAAVMWYPGIASFAETSCIAAIEAQACGTPFVGSLKGALPETVPSGVLLGGDAETEAYQARSIQAVGELLDGCERSSFAYRKVQQAGREHVKAYTFATIAAEWEAFFTKTFTDRYTTHTSAILRNLLHYDDHVVAAHVASDMLEDGPNPEAEAALALCGRVARGEEQGAEDYSDRAVDPFKEIEFEGKPNWGRFALAADQLDGASCILDVACGNGAMAIYLAQRFPSARVVGLDYAPANIAVATAAAEHAGVADRVTFHAAAVWDLPNGTPAAFPPDVAEAVARETFDGCFVGEFLEHVEDAPGLVDHVESLLAPDARVVFTMPSGPFLELLPRNIPLKRGHVHHFCGDDLQQVFGQKGSFRLTYLNRGVTQRGRAVGHWVVGFRAKAGGPARPRDVAHRALTTRPMARLSVGLIAHNAAADLPKCLDKVWPVADEILVGDTGSTDDTAAIAAEYGASVISLPTVQAIREGFAGARNAVLQRATGEWFLWVDTDEWLTGGQWLHKYLDTRLYHGFAVNQNHLMLDGPMGTDKPVRVFRTGRDVQFYGCVHEQPALDRGNTDIMPCLAINDVSVTHTGYLTEDIRRTKMLRRNLPLLQRDQEVFPDRRLGKVLVLRDLINLAQVHALEMDRPDVARRYFGQAIGLFQKYFADPADKFHWLARQPWYEIALKGLGLGFEIEYALGGAPGDLPASRRAKVRKVRVLSYAELDGLIQHELKTIKAQMEPAPLKTDPFTVTEGVAA